jgi:predicted NBD/HSP70 family sugar kinase
MTKAVGVMAASGEIRAGLVEGNRLAGAVRVHGGELGAAMRAVPAEQLAGRIRELVDEAAQGEAVEAVGIGFPGIVRGGVIEEAPRLQQVKGFHLAEAITRQRSALRVTVLNDADAIAAGLAATRGGLGGMVRLWYLGEGIGFGRYPRVEEPWEAGHMVVSLDPKEKFCSCGGVGHLEGFLGQRAMRLRFLDREPDEVFAGEGRRSEFARTWHRALAAATATAIHLEGAGKFYVAGPGAHHLDPGLAGLYLSEMVKMSPLQGSVFEVVGSSEDLGIIGAAVIAAI